jgi:Fur family ferric uptake transcriptional regulator
MDRVLYATRARRAVLTLMRSEPRYLSAAQIYAAIRSENPSMAISTVYRTLELLEATEVVSRRSVDGKETTFVYCGEHHHHHAICRICGHVDEVECDAMDEIKASLNEQRGFELDDHAVEFYGRCSRCRRLKRS